MTLQDYPQRFGSTLTNYRHQKKELELSYQSDRISNKLIQHHIDKLLREAITHPFEEQRINAIEKLGRYGRSSFELGILSRMSRNDPNLELRAAAIKAIGQIKTRLK